MIADGSEIEIEIEVGAADAVVGSATAARQSLPVSEIDWSDLRAATSAVVGPAAGITRLGSAVPATVGFCRSTIL